MLFYYIPCALQDNGKEIMEKEEIIAEFDKLLSDMEKFKASDLHLKVHSPPIYRVSGKAQRLKNTEDIDTNFTQALAEKFLNAHQNNIFKTTGAVDFSHSIAGMGRYRINIYKQRDSISLVARRIPFQIPALEKLCLPASVERLADLTDGLILVVGMTGSGKSTTLASIINRINQKRRCHILTIEDPIEFLHKDARSFINQREIGSDAPDFHAALRAAMRQDPDVILVGEIRDAETMETALAAAETGHLVLGTLHATNTTQTITRIVDFFPADRHSSIRQILSLSLKAVAAQKLIPGCTESRPLVPALELLLSNPTMRKLIAENELAKIRDNLKLMAAEGMQDFNTSLYDLVTKGLISKSDALLRSENPEQLELNLNGIR